MRLPLGLFGLALAAAVAGCAPRPVTGALPLPVLPTVTTALPDPAPPPVATPEPRPEPAPTPAPRPALLYERTDEDLRGAYAAGLAILLQPGMGSGAARRLSAGEVADWLGQLRRVSPESERYARQQLGPVLQERGLVAYARPGSNDAGCARMRETLFVSVPERHQTANRRFVGLIVREACGDAGRLCLRCTPVRGEAPDGGRAQVCAMARCGG